MSLRSLHPNHVWQIDASRCVLFYLPRASKGDSGLRIMDHTDFYKNKPANVIKVINESLWRYVVTDHTSGWNYSTYVTGGENATNLVDVLIDAMHRREGEAMFGVPLMVMLDPGSANTSAIFKTCKALRIHVQINKPKNPRAKGQVEKGQDITERDFESTLRLLPSDKVDSLEKINALVARWRRYFNGTRIHTRTGRTRDSAWLHITPEQLVTRQQQSFCGHSRSAHRVARGFHALARQLPRFRLRRVVGAWRLRWREAAGLREPWAQDTVQVVMSDDEATRPTRSCNVSPMTIRYGRRCARDRRELCPSRRHARADQRQGPGTDGDRHLHRDRSQGGTQGRHRRLRRAD